MDNLQGLTIDDFSGGMTDFIVGGSIRQNEIIKNMVIDENRDLVTRPGSRPKFEYRITSTEVARRVFAYDSDFLVQAETSLYEMGASGATAINLEGATDAFLGAGTSTKVFNNSWNDNIIFTSSDLIYPLKCWKNENGDFKLQRLGMPYILLTYLVSLANDVKAKFNAHIADTGEHSSSDAGNAVASDDAIDYDTMLVLTQEILTKYELHLSAAAKHPGAVDSAHSLEEDEILTVFGAASALGDIKTKLNLHDNDGTAHTAGGGSHQVTVKSTRSELLTSAGGTGSSYLYALHYKYTYQTLEKTFIENSDVLYLELSDIGTPDANNVTITLPNLSTLVGYDVANIKVAIFRTKVDGQSFFKVAEVDASDTTYVDAKSDTDIENNAPLYVEGGILADEPPPKAKFSALVNDTLVLGNIKDGLNRLPNFIQLSKQGRPCSHPNTFRQEFEGDVVGIGYINVYPIVFLEDKVYRVEGSFNSSGQGFLRKRLITDSVGALSHSSIVNTKDGVFFAGPDGFYATDGFKARKVSIDLNHTYAALANKSDISGTYDKLNNRVLWSTKRDSANTYNDSIFIAHLENPTEKQGFAFSFFDGGRDIENFFLGGIGFDNDGNNNDLLRVDPDGYLIYHNEAFTDDCFVVNTKTPDLWDTQTIIYDIDTVAMDMGNSKSRKWIPKVNVNARNVSALSLQISSANDNTNIYEELNRIIDQSNVAWGDPTVIWGDDSVLWNLLPIISQWRYFPASRQAIRCMYKQLRFTNAYIEIDDEANIGNCSVDSASSTISLLSYPTNSWIDESVNYFISFAHENYEFEYKITSISDGDLVVSDSSNTLTSSTSTAWRIRGYKKGETLNLSNYVLSYAPITMTQVTGQGGTP
jgi:hypothetical protein